jgi:hypothetical protein
VASREAALWSRETVVAEQGRDDEKGLDLMRTLQCEGWGQDATFSFCEGLEVFPSYVSLSHILSPRTLHQ